jgi:hypothetical protein
MTDVNILKPDDENEVSIYGVYKDWNQMQS